KSEESPNWPWPVWTGRLDPMDSFWPLAWLLRSQKELKQEPESTLAVSWREIAFPLFESPLRAALGRGPQELRSNFPHKVPARPGPLPAKEAAQSDRGSVLPSKKYDLSFQIPCPERLPKTLPFFSPGPVEELLLLSMGPFHPRRKARI